MVCSCVRFGACITTITLGAFSPDTRNNAAAGDVSELLAPTAGPMPAEQQRTIFNFSDHNFLLHEFWSYGCEVWVLRHIVEPVPTS